MQYNYNDGLCHGGRTPRLYMAKGSKLVKFDGKTIPEVCLVVIKQFEKNGKWSNTQYTLELSPGVRAIEMISPMHGGYWAIEVAVTLKGSEE